MLQSKSKEKANMKLTRECIIRNTTYGISTNAKSNKGVTSYVIPDESSNYPNLNAELIQPLSSIKNRLSKKDYEKYLKGEK